MFDRYYLTLVLSWLWSDNSVWRLDSPSHMGQEKAISQVIAMNSTNATLSSACYATIKQNAIVRYGPTAVPWPTIFTPARTSLFHSLKGMTPPTRRLDTVCTDSIIYNTRRESMLACLASEETNANKWRCCVTTRRWSRAWPRPNQQSYRQFPSRRWRNSSL